MSLVEYVVWYFGLPAVRHLLWAAALGYVGVWILAAILARTPLFAPKDPRVVMTDEYGTFGAWAAAFSIHAVVVVVVGLLWFLPGPAGIIFSTIWYLVAAYSLVIIIDVALVILHLQYRKKSV